MRLKSLKTTKDCERLGKNPAKVGKYIFHILEEIDSLKKQLKTLLSQPPKEDS